MKKRGRLSILFLLVAGAGALLSAICFRDTHRYILREYEVVSDKIDRDMTLCLLADLHGKSYGDRNRELVRAVADIRPDLVLGAGDLISSVRDKKEKGVRAALHLLLPLAKKYPVYLSNGNHEYRLFLEPKRSKNVYRRYVDALSRAGIKILRNETVRTDGNISVTGLETPFSYYRKFTPGKLTAEHINKWAGTADGKTFRILLAHNPTYMRAYADWGADLILSGHYHGGILRLPKLGGVISPMLTLFPHYDGGRYDEYGTTMIVSRGLGTHTLHIRINNPAELVVIRLKKENNVTHGH